MRIYIFDSNGETEFVTTVKGNGVVFPGNGYLLDWRMSIFDKNYSFSPRRMFATPIFMPIKIQDSFLSVFFFLLFIKEIFMLNDVYSSLFDCFFEKQEVRAVRILENIVSKFFILFSI